MIAPLSKWKIDVIGWKMAVFLNIACRKWTFLAGFSALPSSQMALCDTFWLLMLTLVMGWNKSLSSFTGSCHAYLFIWLYCMLHRVHIIETWMSGERFRAHISVLESAVIAEAADGCLQRRGWAVMRTTTTTNSPGSSWPHCLLMYKILHANDLFASAMF